MPDTTLVDRRRFLGRAAMAAAAARLGLIGAAFQQAGCTALGLPAEGEMPPFDGATTWLNSPPLATAGLRGKVVLVQFWTYTCINWLRTLPYVRAWSEKYRDEGLAVVGVHSPEFTFEKAVDNVRREVKTMNVPYPVAVDSDHAVWRAFNNAYWPASYFADATGKLRYHHFGEGDYDGSERMIQRLLAEAGHSVGSDLVAVQGRGAEAAADWGALRSSENYVGYDRTRNFASPGGALSAERRVYAIPAHLEPDHWALAGSWTMHGQATALNALPGRIAYRFHARDLHLVMGPPAGAAPVRFRVRLDGQPPGPSHGADVDQGGNGMAAEQRLYQLIRQAAPIADREFEIEFLDPGVEAFSFTFG